MAEPYGLPAGTGISYGALGFPAWVDETCRRWGLDSSTYPGHQEGDRRDIGAAPNPNDQNRGIDWAGDPQQMLDFARWLVSIGPNRTPGQYGPPGLEMVIYEHAPTGERVWYPPWVNYDADFSGHRDHVHTRQSASLIDVAPPPISKADEYALAIIAEGQRRGITERGIKIALSVALVESGLKNYANSNVPESLGIQHDAVGSDHDSLGLFQQRCPMWGPAHVLMDPSASAGLFYDQLQAMDYNDESRSPGSFAADIQRPAAQYRGRYDDRFDEASALYDRLASIPLPPTPQPPGEVWMPDASVDQLVREIHQALFEKLPSKSRYGDAQHLWNVIELIRNDDGFWFDKVTQDNALLNDQWSQEAIERAINNGDQLARAFYERHVGGRHGTASPVSSSGSSASTPTPPSPPFSGATINDTIMALAAQMQALKQMFIDSIGGK